MDPRPESLYNVTGYTRFVSVLSVYRIHVPRHYTVLREIPVLVLFSHLSVTDLRPTSFYSDRLDTRLGSVLSFRRVHDPTPYAVLVSTSFQVSSLIVRTWRTKIHILRGGGHTTQIQILGVRVVKWLRQVFSELGRTSVTGKSLQLRSIYTT